MPKRVVICGSMSNYADILDCKRRLSKAGIECLVPQPDQEFAVDAPERFRDFKRDAAKAYFMEIAREDTFGILVVNTPKKGIPNYIGANAFAEIALAFYADKRIYVLHDFYGQYSDELYAWEVHPLRGKLEHLLVDYKRVHEEESSASFPVRRLALASASP
jgi:hypothetical protein